MSETYTFEIQEVDGFKWIFRQSSWLHGRYQDLEALKVEPELYSFLLEHAKGTFVDIGAHVGRYTIRLADKSNKVIAIEPNPYNIQGLLMNIALNRITNVDVLPIALSDEDKFLYTGTIGFREELANRTFESGQDALIVKCRKLDDIIESADLIKIDTEGYEYKVLCGAIRIIRQTHPSLAIETHEKAWNIPKQVSQIEEFLTSNGYSFKKVRYNRDFHILASHNLK